MAAPHLDNPYGAKGGEGGKTDDGKGISGKEGDKGKGGKGKVKADVGQSDSDSDLPKCAHPFCNEPSDPSNFPVGLPWASGLLKCLPGYCKKHRRDSIAEMMSSEEMGEEIELDEFVKHENVCKCKDPPPLACPHKQDGTTKTDKTKVCGKPYPKYVYPDDPCVNQELVFFLRMMMVADELDRWQEEDQKKEKEEAKKRGEKAKKNEEKGKEAKTDSKGKKKKSKAGGKSAKDKGVKKADDNKTKSQDGGNTDDT